MSKIGIITWKELRAYFTSWMAYALLCGWMFISGLLFMLLATQQEFSLASMYPFLITVLLFVAPLITMRLVAEERVGGTLEMLMTSPVTEWQVTLGKFFGAWSFVGALMVATLQMPFIAVRYGSIDTGPVIGGYIALACAGAAFVAFGLFCSSLTESQVVAAFLTFSGLLISLMMSWLGDSFPTSDAASFLSQATVFSHIQQLARGAVDTKDLIYFASVTILFLFGTVRVLESRKWR